MESQLKEMPEQQRNAMQRRAQQAFRAPQKLRPRPRRSEMKLTRLARALALSNVRVKTEDDANLGK